MDAAAEAEFWSGVAHAEAFFMNTAPVKKALLKLVAALDGAGVPYAIVGAMALNEYGYRRVTSDVDVLLTSAGLARFKERVLGRGYVEKFPGSKGLRDTEHNVQIDVLLAGEYPGDGLVKPVVFPDPEQVARRGTVGSFLPLHLLLDLKLASGMSAAHRLKDLADVLEVIKAAALPREFAQQIDASVRDKFEELWRAAQIRDPEE